MLLEDIEMLHTVILEGDLEKVKALFLNESKDEKNSTYQNSKEPSALWRAIKAKKFEIYAFLQSKGLKFRDEEEQKCISDELDQSEKNSLKEALYRYFTTVDKAHILYLVSKTKSFEQQVKGPNFQKEVTELYDELDKIPEISIILEVLQYSGNLDIIVDFEEDSISVIDPTGGKEVKGRCNHELKRLYTGLNRPKCNRLGTLAHEFTHLVMQTIYKNDCKPYYQSDAEQESKFKTIINNINKGHTTANKIIRWVFELYEENVWPSELIVRVPHMLATYGTIVGREKLQVQASELLEYYEKNVMHDCKRFIEDSYLINPRSDIPLLNSRITDRIVDIGIQFKEAVNLKKFFESENKQMLLLNVTNTWLCTVNVYQSVQQIQPYSDYHLFLKFDHYVKQKEKINNLFYNSEASNLLIIQSPDNLDEKQLKEVLKFSFSNLKIKPNKKLIFIINESERNGFMKILNSIANLYPAQNKLYQIDLKEDFTLNDLTKETQNKILQEKKVIFQRQMINLNQVINDNSKQLVDAKTLENLINNNEVTIGDKLPISIGYDASYYIERTFVYQPSIKKEVFKAKTPFGKEITDVFAVSNINQENLKELVPQGNEVELFEGGTNDKITRFYILNNEKAPRLFIELCQKNPEFNVHWLKHESESNSFIWQQSQGSLSILREHINNDYTKSYLETDWIKQADYYKKIIIISDTAGMGKSTILTSFSQLIKKENPDVWLTRIDLNNHTDKLSEQKEKASFKTQEIDIAIAFLANNLLQLKTPFEQALFKHYCQHSKLIVMFDGFDEISPDYKETVIDLIQTLRKSQIKQIWITTRLNKRADLEDAFQQFTHMLKPFSEDNQKEFLTKFWAQKLTLSKDNEKLKYYAGTLIKLLAKSISDKEKEFTGIPLQTRMLGEIFQNKCQEFCNSEQPIPTLPDKLDLIDLYESFFKIKFHIYQVEKNQLDISKPGLQSDADALYAKFIEQHQSLALYTLFGEEERKVLLNEKFCQELSVECQGLAQAVSQDENLTALLMTDKQNTIHALMENIKEGKERTGIIDQIIEDKPHFIHRTFAEYLAANFLVNILLQSTTEKCSVIQEFLLKNILTEPDYQVIRAFINQQLLKKEAALPESMLKLYGEKIADLMHKNYQKTLQLRNLYNRNWYSILHIAANENNGKIVSIILDIISKSFKEDRILIVFMECNKNNKKHTALHVAAQKGYLDIVVSLVEKGADIKKLDERGRMPHHLAAERGAWEIVKYLVEKGADVNVKDNTGWTLLRWAAERDNLEIVQYLVEKGAYVKV